MRTGHPRRPNRVSNTWYCEVCEKLGRITFHKDADVYSVYYRIEGQHGRKSPVCQQENGMERIRVSA